MPIIKSAKKRVRVAGKATARNRKTKRQMRDAVKAAVKVLAGGKSADIAKALTAATSAIDRAAKKNVIAKNKAARMKSSLSAQAKKAGFKPSKSPTKKPAVKKAPAKKPIAKKPVAKKPAAKKASSPKK